MDIHFYDYQSHHYFLISRLTTLGGIYGQFDEYCCFVVFIVESQQKRRNTAEEFDFEFRHIEIIDIITGNWKLEIGNQDE